ncbi:hypothetical protein HGRIS_014852 [Hohenbuehelia grisea]|uniref:Uncharacterized protein n=1 Tax=Hohenbuehelia grisea TaxID=104357 RepID=A0ABR3IQZ7_9AGAR
MTQQPHPTADIDSATNKYKNNLEPPIGTSFFNTESKRILNAHTPWCGRYYTPKNVYYNLGRQLYKYAVSGDPHNADFASRGGRIFLIMVHSGRVASNIVVRSQSPQTNTGQKDGDDTRHEIDFRQAFQMLRNNGNDPFTFDATYIETFTRKGSHQVGEVKDDGVVFKIEGIDGGRVEGFTNHAIHGFSVFTGTHLSDFPTSFSEFLST